MQHSMLGCMRCLSTGCAVRRHICSCVQDQGGCHGKQKLSGRQLQSVARAVRRRSVVKLHHMSPGGVLALHTLPTLQDKAA